MSTFDWRPYASCESMAFQYPPDQNPFFKLGRGNTYEEAREICAGCPVVVDCLLANLEEMAGMFGCTSKNERDAIRRSIKLGMSFVKSVEQVWQSHRDASHDKAPPIEVWEEWS